MIKINLKKIIGKDGYWKQDEGNHFGCSACECSPGGSEHPFCLKQVNKEQNNGL